MFQAFLVAVVAWIQASFNPISWSFFHQPMMAGLWVGLIYGKPIEGIMIGAAINVAYLGWISAGGANPSDIFSAGLLGTAVALQSGFTPEQAVAIAMPLGIIGNYAWVTWMTVNSIWPSVQDKRAEQGDVRGIILLQCIPGQVLLWILRSLPAFIVAYYGPSLVQTVMGALPTWVMAGLNTVGKALPAIGIAMLIKYMARKELIPFFALGFVVNAFSESPDLMYTALLGIILCLVYVSIKPTFESV